METTDKLPLPVISGENLDKELKKPMATHYPEGLKGQTQGYFIPIAAIDQEHEAVLSKTDLILAGAGRGSSMYLMASSEQLETLKRAFDIQEASSLKELRVQMTEHLLARQGLVRKSIGGIEKT